MPTQPYFTKDGERVPGTTTVISRFKESGGLIHWAWQLGKDGRDYRQERDAAASAGTLAHAMVEAFLRKTEVDFSGYPADQFVKASNAFEQFRRWADMTRLVCDEPEVALVSEQYRFGGTMDGITVEGQRAILDWKTSNSVYADYLIQVAAYGLLWNEHHPDDPIVGGYHIVRFSKEEADFEHRFFGEAEDAKRLFVLYREAYGIDQKLRKRVR